MSGPTELPYSTIEINPGDRRLIGLQSARENVRLMMSSGRLGHAYLIAGPSGSGKKALALAMAEITNGIDHLTDLKGTAFSRKSTWANHPDVHVFLPLPGSEPDMKLLRERKELLAKDPYEVTDFSLRPDVSGEEATKNKNAFYSIKYFKESIQKVAFLKRNEGFRNIIIITEIERMRKEAANSFLKLLEEPPEGVMFILTTDNANMLLPTIISRCQLIRTAPLSAEDITQGLIQYDGVAPDDALFLARASSGSYAAARFYDVKRLKQSRAEILKVLRSSYSLDAVELNTLITGWHKDYNREGLAGILNLLEVLVRDLEYYRATQDETLITNIDQLDVIRKFCEALGNARLDEMQQLFNPFRNMIRQNVSPKIAFTVLAFRMAYLMRGKDTPIKESEPWLHIPAIEEMG